MRLKSVISVVVVVVIVATAFIYFRIGERESPDSPQSTARVGSAPEQESKKASVGEDSDQILKRSTVEVDVSLSGALAEALALSEGGDALASKRAAEILQYCWTINVDPARWDQHMKEQGDRAPESRAQIEAAYARKRDRCSGVMGGDAYDESLSADLLSKAGEGGDVGALVKLSLQSGDVPPEEGAALLDSVVASGDPNNIRDAGLLINFLGSEAGERFQPLANSELGAQAWQVAACRRGASCGAGSVVMDGLCMSTGRCGFSDYEAFVRSQWVPQGRSADFERLVRHAESIINGD